MKVSVAIALPGRQEVFEVELPDGATAREAVAAANLVARFPEVDVAALKLGIWSRPCAPEARLREGDRVELYRPLAMDAKAMRRSRIKASSPRSRSGR
jgi:putative ubiquitin-RnfH superfamily antitoxin RatB of RatAB toxin-antitoxin module